MRFRFIVILGLCAIVSPIHAQMSISTGANSLDFSSYSGTGLSPGVVVSGSLDSDIWAVDLDDDGSLDASYGETNTGSPYAGGTQTGTGSAGVLYAYSVGSGTPAMGIRPVQNNSSDADEFNSTVLKVENSTGGVITGLTITYDVYYRGQNNRTLTIAFEHSADLSIYEDPGTLDFSVSASVGNTWTKGSSPSATVSDLSIGNGGIYYLKWIFEDAINGGNTAIAIDKISITPIVAYPASTSQLTLGSAGSSTISSLTTSSSGQQVFSFTVQDDGTSSASDVFNTTINEIIIQKGDEDDLTDWSEVIAGAQLTDGTNTINSSSINKTNITFSAIPYTNTTDLGYIADNGSKTFTLSLWFNSSISETIDHKTMQFSVTDIDVSTYGASSGIDVSEEVNSSNTRNQIVVNASQWYFKDVPSSVGTGLDFSMTIAATDVNGNIDTDESSSFTLSLNTSPSASSLSAASLTNVPVSSGSYSYSDVSVDKDGSYVLEVSGSSLTSATSTSILAGQAYRSKVSGNWSSPGTWQLHTGGTWVDASSTTPTNSDGPITIQANHSVNFDQAITVDQLTIESTGTLVLSSSLTLNDQASENDLVVSGTLDVQSTGHNFGGAGGSVEVKEGGIVTTSLNSMEGILAGASSSGIFIYQDGAIFQYTNTSTNNFSGETYFPDATTTVPILRTSFTGSLNNMNNLKVNGIWEVNGSFDIKNSNAGTMLIRNGITGTGNVTCNSNGRFIMTGATLYFGGTGVVNFGGVNGYTFGADQTIVLTSDKEMQNGDFTFNEGAVFQAGNYQLHDGTANNMSVSFASGAIIEAKGSNGLSGSGAGLLDVQSLVINSAADFKFSGVSAQATNFADLGVSSVGHLTIDNSDGVILTENVSIDEGVSFVNGCLTTTSSNMLTMSASSTFQGEGSSSFVDGPVTLEGVLDKTIIPVGDGVEYRPVTLDPVSASTFIVSHVSGTPVDDTDITGFNNLLSSRYWQISRTTGSGNVEVTLFIDQSTDGFTPSSEELLAHYNTTSTSWEVAGTGYDSHTSNSITATTSDFSDFTIGTTSSVTVLPVEWTKFIGYQNDENVRLQWETASELNNDRFEILRSENGYDFKQIGQVEGNGTTNSPKIYQFDDPNPLQGNNIYQLRQIDYDGTSDFSDAIIVEFSSKERIFTFQNPIISRTLQYKLTGRDRGVHLQIADLKGQVVIDEYLDPSGTEHHKSIDLNSLTPGIYTMSVWMDHHVDLHSIIVSPF